jgi:hypothetical protein
MTTEMPAPRDDSDPLFSDEYYELLERLLGPEKAAWARLPRAEREKELTWLHEQFDTPDDLDEWPPELGGGVFNP